MEVKRTVRTEVEEVVAAHLPRKGLDCARVLHRVQQHHLRNSSQLLWHCPSSFIIISTL